MPKSAQSGQALLIILLIMAVVLTIALSVVSRSVSDVTVSQKEEEASRAFSVAEAGIEQALIAGCPGGVCTDTLETGSFRAEVTTLAEGGKTYNIPMLLNSGETVPIWFVNHDDDGNLVCSAENPCFTGNTVRVCWGESGISATTGTTPALELSVLYTSSPGDYSTAKIGRGAYDPNTTRRSSNSFSGQDGSCTLGGVSYAFGKTVNLNSDLGIPGSATSNQNGLQQARLRLLYNTDRAHPVGISVDFGGNGFLPKQGTQIESTGEAGKAARKIIVQQLFPDLPPIFDFGIFSGSGGLTK